jgi:hypothetical protein
LLPPVHTYGGIRPEEEKERKSLFLFTAQQIEKSKSGQVFSESRSGTIAHKNKRRITAVTQWQFSFALQRMYLGPKESQGIYLLT